MTLKRMHKIVDALSTILMKSFEFNGIEIEMNYVARAKHAKNWVIATHYHPWFEFNYVSKGSLYTTINEKEFPVHSGQSYIIPPGVPHSHRHNNTGDDGICIRFSLRHDKSNPIIRALSASHPSAFHSDIEKINLSGSIYSLQAEFAAWLMRLNDLWETKAPIDPKSGTQNSFSSQVILYLEEYYSQKIKVEEIAVAMNTSYRTLSRKFSAETHMSISDKLTQIRLENAKRLLLSTNLPIYDIAKLCGYENEFYFSRIFKQREHLSPKNYKNKYHINI